MNSNFNPQDREIDWESLKTRIHNGLDDLVDALIVEAGYKFDPKGGKNYAKWLQFKPEGGGERLVLIRKHRQSNRPLIQINAGTSKQSHDTFTFARYILERDCKDWFSRVALRVMSEDEYRSYLGHKKNMALPTNVKQLEKTDLHEIIHEYEQKEITQEDINKVQFFWGLAKPGYLEHLVMDRMISRGTLEDVRFKGRIRLQKYYSKALKKNVQATIFPHYYKKQLVGFERINEEVKLFTSNSIKTFWESNNLMTCKFLVMNEAVIDTLSFADLFPNQSYGFMTLNGEPSEQSKERYVQYLNLRKDNPPAIIFAFDNDKTGRRYANLFKNLIPKSLGFQEANETNINEPGAKLFKEIYPTNGSNDWNDELKLIRSQDGIHLKTRRVRPEVTNEMEGVPTNENGMEFN